MQIGQNAPHLSRQGAPAKKHTITLADIPEAMPGPNAFAEHAARVDRYRMDGNAFFQQEVERRMLTPPTGVHPALRARSNSDSSIAQLRESACTTMSPFINAGFQKQDSPPLKLTPTHHSVAEPTTRGYIEECLEEYTHRQKGDGVGRQNTVFVPSPKIASQDFSNNVGSAAPRRQIEKQVAVSERLAPKTPKKSLLERLWPPNTRSNTTNTTPLQATNNFSEGIPLPSPMPVKAQAVLGASSSASGRLSLGSSPSKSNVSRSPSKRKGIFSRKSHGPADVNATQASLARSSYETDPPPLTASTVGQTPRTSPSGASRRSNQQERYISQPSFEQDGAKENDGNTCTIVRSQSMKYFDHAIPPTPPTKDTPPHERAKKEKQLREMSSKAPPNEDRGTPSKAATGVVSTNPRLSPTRFGSYGFREDVNLVTKPSVRSMHASVFPDPAEAFHSDYEEVRACIDVLGLDGINTAPADVRTPRREMVYSPSIYSPAEAERSHCTDAGSTALLPRTTYNGKNASKPIRRHKKRSPSGSSLPTAHRGSAKGTSATRGPYTRPRGGQKTVQETFQVPVHGRTHSIDHTNSPGYSMHASIFAQHVHDDLSNNPFDSPTSFSHSSAMPSPLQYLPSTKYSAPSQKSTKARYADSEQYSDTPLRRGLGINENSSAPSKSATPSRSHNAFENAPSLPAQMSPALNLSSSPQGNLENGAIDPQVNMDPIKPGREWTLSNDKLDQMLDKLDARNHELASMRDEIRASNARLDERISAMEHLQRSSPTPLPFTPDESASEASLQHPQRVQTNRVSSNVARDFYRPGRSPVMDAVVEGAGATAAASAAATESAEIIELRESNRHLLGMVGVFAEKLKALEKRMAGEV